MASASGTLGQFSFNQKIASRLKGLNYFYRHQRLAWSKIEAKPAQTSAYSGRYRISLRLSDDVLVLRRTL